MKRSHRTEKKAKISEKTERQRPKFRDGLDYEFWLATSMMAILGVLAVASEYLQSEDLERFTTFCKALYALTGDAELSYRLITVLQGYGSDLATMSFFMPLLFFLGGLVQSSSIRYKYPDDKHTSQQQWDKMEEAKRNTITEGFAVTVFLAVCYSFAELLLLTPNIKNNPEDLRQFDKLDILTFMVPVIAGLLYYLKRWATKK